MKLTIYQIELQGSTNWTQLCFSCNSILGNQYLKHCIDQIGQNPLQGSAYGIYFLEVDGARHYEEETQSLTPAVINVAGLLVVVVAPADPAVEPRLGLGAASVAQLDPTAAGDQLPGAQAEAGRGDGAPG